MVVFLNNNTDKYAPLVYDNKYYSLACEADYIYSKSTGIWSFPTIYAKNNESKTVYLPDVTNSTFYGNLQSESIDELEMVSGFSSENYIETPTDAFDNIPYEWYIRFKHKNTGNVQRLFSQNKKYPSGIEITADNKLRLTMSNSTSKYNICNVTGSYTLVDGSWYTIKVLCFINGETTLVCNIQDDNFSGTTNTLTSVGLPSNTFRGYAVYIGSSRTPDIVCSSTTSVKSSAGSWRFGHEPNISSGDCAFGGVLDLKNCKFCKGYFRQASGNNIYQFSGSNQTTWKGTSGTLTVSSTSYDDRTKQIRRFI